MACSWTQADLDALESAIKDGVKEVEYGDKKVVYRSLDEMLKLRNLMRDCLGLNKPVGGLRVFTNFDKGLH